MADQIKEQDPKQATPADSSSDQTQAGPSPSSELKEEDSKKHGPPPHLCLSLSGGPVRRRLYNVVYGLSYAAAGQRRGYRFPSGLADLL